MSSQKQTLSTTLHALLPTTNFLPPDLLSFTTSLLTQSKSKARNLRPEEEIARIYAVSHIAIEKYNASHGGQQRKKRKGPGRPRLLDTDGDEEMGEGEVLELGKIMPPCKPSVYAKLKKFLDGVLVLSGRRSEPNTPKGKEGEAGVVSTEGKRKRGVEDVEGSGKGKKAKVDEEETPSRSVRQSGGSVTARKFAKEGKGKIVKKEMPGWAAGSIRGLCREMDLPKASPHVFVGAETFFQSRRVDEQDLMGFILAVFLFVAAKIQDIDREDEDSMAALRDQAIAAFKDIHAAEQKKQKDDTFPPLPEDDELQKTLDELFKTGQKDSWEEMEWYQNIQTVDDDEEDEADTPRKILPPAKTPLNRREKRARFNADGEEEPGPAGLLPGLGTMFQPSIDWLSDKRRADFAEWKKEILKEIEQQT